LSPPANLTTGIQLANNGTVHPSTPTSSAIIYARTNVSSATQLWVNDTEGTQTQISPHDFSLIGGPSEEMAWSHTSINTREGKVIQVDMLRVARLLEQITGEKLVYIEDYVGQV